MGRPLKSSLRTVAIAIGTLAAVAMLVQTAFVFFAVRKTENTVSAAARAEEQLVIEEYFQKYGVRPASAAEARLLEQANQRREREEREAERQQQRVEEDARRFEEDARQEGEQVAADLRQAEMTLEHETAWQKAQEEQEVRRREAEENERLRREQHRWRQVLSR